MQKLIIVGIIIAASHTVQANEEKRKAFSRRAEVHKKNRDLALCIMRAQQRRKPFDPALRDTEMQQRGYTKKPGSSGDKLSDWSK